MGKFRIGRLLHVEWGTLGNNYHGEESETLRRGVKLVRMGAWVQCWSVYLYRGDGRAHRLTFWFPWWQTEWPNSAGSKPYRKVQNDRQNKSEEV